MKTGTPITCAKCGKVDDGKMSFIEVSVVGSKSAGPLCDKCWKKAVDRILHPQWKPTP